MKTFFFTKTDTTNNLNAKLKGNTSLRKFIERHGTFCG